MKINYLRFLSTFNTQNNLNLDLLFVYQNAKIINGKINKNKRKGANFSMIEWHLLTSFKPGWFN